VGASVGSAVGAAVGEAVGSGVGEASAVNVSIVAPPAPVVDWLRYTVFRSVSMAVTVVPELT